MTSEDTPSCTLPFSVNAKGEHTGQSSRYWKWLLPIFIHGNFDTIEHFNNSKLFQQLKNRKYGVGKLYDEFVSNAGADTNCWYVSKKRFNFCNED